MRSRVYYPAAKATLQVVFDGFGEDDADSEPRILNVLPRSATIHRNGYRQADSWEMTFDANDLPLDPQLIRAATAEISVYDRETGDPGPMIFGLFDDMRLEMSGSGKWVTISGQDYTAFLIAKQWPPTERGTARRIPVGQRLDTWLTNVLNEADPQGRLRVLVENVPTTELPYVGRGETSTNGRGIPIEQNTSYWDVIYKVVTRYGYVVFVRGLDVVITRPKNIENVAQHEFKRLAWGLNLESLQLTRHLGKEKVPRIIVQSYDPDSRRVIKAEFPDGSLKRSAADVAALKQRKKSTLTERLNPPKKKAASKETIRLEDEYQIIPVFGISDRAVLKRMAETLHELLGRSERTIVATTRDLTDIDGASMLDVNPGDAVDLEWQDFNREHIANLTEGERFQHLVSRGFSDEIAGTIARNYTKLVGEKKPLRVREVTYEYSVDDGLSIEMELIDFVTVSVRSPDARGRRKDAT